MGRHLKQAKYSTNPFLEGVELRKGVSRGKEYVMASGSGEVVGEIVERKVEDTEPFVKYFSTRDGWWYSKLSKSGWMVLHYIIGHLRRDKDWVEMNIEEIREWCRMKSRQSVYSGIKEMVDGGVIVPSDEEGRWWINPGLMFNGNRKKVIKQQEYVRTKRVTAVRSHTE